MNLIVLGIILALSKVISIFACYHIQSFIFSIAMSIQQLIIFSIPVYVFLSIYTSVYKFPASKKYFALILVIIIFLSNATNLFIFSNISKYLLVQPNDSSIQTLPSLDTLFKLPISTICSNYAMIVSGIILGIIMQYMTINQNTKTDSNITTIENPIASCVNCALQITFQYMQYFMKYYLIFFIYIMLIGIFLNIIYSQILSMIMSNYYHLITIIIFGYIGMSLVYTFIICKINTHSTTQYSIKEIWKNIFIPLSIGGPAMSSGLAIPSNIEATTKNTKDSIYSNFIIPITANIHMGGDTIVISALNILTLLIFNYDIPDLHTIILFAIYGAIYKFSSACVPGGGIMILHGLLVYIFNYTPEMLVVITSSYILLDMVATAGNIMFNYLLAVILHPIYSKK